jgi:2-oxo-3-(phosphooxy)propyl 3-oxoalkanoate synthase
VTVDAQITGTVEAERALKYTRTIDRRDVHRLAVSEVLLTDQRQTGELDVAAAAQLPLNHSYFSDHVGDPPRFDVLLLVEACRQAGIAGSHLLGVPRQTVMLVGSFDITVPDPRVLIQGGRPGEMRIAGHFTPTRVRGGVVRRGTVTQELTVNGQPAGTHRSEVSFVSLREHEALRRMQRATPAPLTTDFPDIPAASQAVPSLVRRVHPLNVVLSAVRLDEEHRDEERLVANVTPRFGNRALFDHTYDHVPAMVMAEAARQLAVASFGQGTTVPVLTGVNAEFGRHAELDLPLRAVLTGGQVTFDQGPATAHTPIARVSLSFEETDRMR